MTSLLLIAVVLSGAPAKTPKSLPETCHVYAKRCEPACRKAHQDASNPNGPCGKEVKAFNAAVSKKPDAALPLGKCLRGCAPKDELTCVGPPSDAACDCQSACFKQFVPDALEPAKAAMQCYHPLVAPSCQ